MTQNPKQPGRIFEAELHDGFRAGDDPPLTSDERRRRVVQLCRSFMRTNLGATRRPAAQHSQSLHALVAHIPGVKVALPSSAYEAKGLLKTAIRDDTTRSSSSKTS